MTAPDLVALLARRGETVAAAESLTGGRVAMALTSVAGASAVVRGGVVAYATEVKVAVAGVPQPVIDSFGVISAECAIAMALGVRRRLGATWGVATTGVAGPGLQEDQPVGTVFVAVAGPDDTCAERWALSGSRVEIQAAATQRALQLLARVVGREEPVVG